MTWPISAYDVPSTNNFPQTPDYYNFTDKFAGGYMKGVNYSNHEEDIYVGYRYFDTFGKPVAYPFGFGLSYTTFKYSNLKASAKGNKVNVDVTVTNTGKTAGKQVAQIYVSAPKGNIQKPKRELKGFGKTRLLKPGESQTLHMVIDRRDLTSFDEANSQWLGEAGDYAVEVGDNIEDITSSVKVRLSEYTEKVHDVMKPDAQLNLLRQ